MNVSINARTESVHQGRDNARIGERRKTTDKWSYVLRSLAVISWLLFFLALAIAYGTAQENNPSLNYYIETQTNQTWLLSISEFLYEILWASAFGSYLCLVMAKYRSRRKKDNKHFHITMLLTTTLAWATYMLTAI